MNELERLELTKRKIQARKDKIKEEGISSPSFLANTAREFISPVFKVGVGLLYPKVVLLGKTKAKDVKHLTSDHPTIYAPAHRGTFDAARFILAMPHSYFVVGDERVFYCTTNELLWNMNGIIYVDREDKEDRRTLNERCSKVLESSSLFKKYQSIMLAPEGVPNVYGKENLQLYPGIIKIALNTGSYIVPLGNELNILWDQEEKNIIGDENYMMYEDYHQQSLLRPSDDLSLVKMYQNLDEVKYLDAYEDKTMESFINANRFRIGEISFNLEDKLKEFLNDHPLINEFMENLQMLDPHKFEAATIYLKKCTVVKDLADRQLDCLNILDQRMRKLSDQIKAEITLRHPKTPELLKREEEEYIDFYLKNVVEVGKKGPTTAEAEIDMFINKTTDDDRVNRASKNVLRGLKTLLKNEELYQECHSKSLCKIKTL